MALLTDIDESYTKTGKGTLASWSSKLSMIPFVGGWLAFPLGAAGTIIETAQWLFRGKIGNAITALLAGGVSTAANAFVGGGSDMGGITNGSPFTWWGGNLASGGLTGATLGTHARALTETVIGGVTGVLGVKPEILQSYPVAIGSIGGGMAQAGPGKFLSEAARSRGEDPNAAYARVSSNQADHLAALEAAKAQGPAYRGA